MTKHLLAQPWVIRLRNRARHNPLLRALYRRWMAKSDYEERFSHRLMSGVGTSTVVWDIGANVGLYTQQFLDRGALHVAAFEPAPDAVVALRARFGPSSLYAERVTIVPTALSDTVGTARFSANGTSVTNRLVAGDADSAHAVETAVTRADRTAMEYRLPRPNLVKIDVEGFELEVLRGFGDMLGEAELRGIFVEVHFSQLHERGLDSAPTEIEALLAANGFVVEWADLSHVVGVRVGDAS